MAFKGKTTIELTNAETGVVEQKIEDENMVTNAVYNLVNGSCGSTELNTILNNCFSGLLLFEKNITEDVNTLVMPVENKMVGKGAGAYGLEDEPLIGNLNTAESTSLENGHRYVWDFATNRGNGTIRSVSLTSYKGGLTGYELTPNAKYDNYNFMIFQPRGSALKSGATPLAYNSSVITSLDKNKPIIGYVNKKLIFANGTGGENSVTFSTRTTDKTVHLKNWTSYNYTEKLITSNKKLCSPINFTFYNNKYYSIYITSKTTFDVVVFNVVTFEIEKEETITCQDTKFLTGSATIRNPIIYKGYYYIPESVSNEGYYYKINADDPTDYVARIFNSKIKYIYSSTNTPTITQSRLNICGDFLFFLPATTSDFSSTDYVYYCTVAFWDGESVHKSVFISKRMSNITIVNNTDVKLPYVVLFENYSGARIHDVIFTPFLSTINNLSTPVVKNETQTMKVTYEITEI